MDRLTNVEIADDGWPVLALAGILTILVSFAALPVGCFLLGIMMWLAHILRMPRRQTPLDENLVVAPADGCIVQIVNHEANSGIMVLPNDSLRITIRTKLSDVQLQTSPVTGHLIDNCLFPGLFSPWQEIDKENELVHMKNWEDVRNLNERREITLQNAVGHKIIMVQLATQTARQLVCRFAEGKYLSAGSPLGMSRLAGVVDIYLPANTICDVAIGQNVLAGETMLAQLPSQLTEDG